MSVLYSYDVYEVPLTPDGALSCDTIRWSLLMSTPIRSYASFTTDFKLILIRDEYDPEDSTSLGGHVLELMTLGVPGPNKANARTDARHVADPSAFDASDIQHPYGLSHPQLQPLPSLTTSVKYHETPPFPPTRATSRQQTPARNSSKRLRSRAGTPENKEQQQQRWYESCISRQGKTLYKLSVPPTQAAQSERSDRQSDLRQAKVPTAFTSEQRLELLRLHRDDRDSLAYMDMTVSCEACEFFMG